MPEFLLPRRRPANIQATDSGVTPDWNQGNLARTANAEAGALASAEHVSKIVVDYEAREMQNEHNADLLRGKTEIQNRLNAYNEQILKNKNHNEVKDLQKNAHADLDLLLDDTDENEQPYFRQQRTRKEMEQYIANVKASHSGEVMKYRVRLAEESTRTGIESSVQLATSNSNTEASYKLGMATIAEAAAAWPGSDEEKMARLDQWRINQDKTYAENLFSRLVNDQSELPISDRVEAYNEAVQNLKRLSTAEKAHYQQRAEQLPVHQAQEQAYHQKAIAKQRTAQQHTNVDNVLLSWDPVTQMPAQSYAEIRAMDLPAATKEKWLNKMGSTIVEKVDTVKGRAKTQQVIRQIREIDPTKITPDEKMTLSLSIMDLPSKYQSQVMKQYQDMIKPDTGNRNLVKGFGDQLDSLLVLSLPDKSGLDEKKKVRKEQKGLKYESRIDLYSRYLDDFTRFANDPKNSAVDVRNYQDLLLKPLREAKTLEATYEAYLPRHPQSHHEEGTDFQPGRRGFEHNGKRYWQYPDGRVEEMK